MSEEQKHEISKVLTNGVRLAGDTLIAPGSSQILEGKVGGGLARFAVGLAARAVLGPIGWIAVGLDSYSKTTTGKGLLERLQNQTPAPPAPQPVAVTVAAVAKNG